MEEETTQQIPDTLIKNTVIDGKVWLPGVGKRRGAELLFVTDAVSYDEGAEVVMRYGREVKRTPRLLTSVVGNTFKHLAMQSNILLDDQYTVALIRHAPDAPKGVRKIKEVLRGNAKKEIKGDMRHMAYLEKDIEKIKPKIIVCLGKEVYDELSPVKMSADDLLGVFNYSERYNALMYCMPKMANVLSVDMLSRFEQDFNHISKELSYIKDSSIQRIEQKYTVINNAEHLRSFVEFLRSNNINLLSVDCEWDGSQHVDGKLRSIQFCWAPGHAVYVRFMDDQVNYVFDVPYSEAGEILGSWLNNPDMRYIGHHISSDYAWMHHVLNLEWYGRTVMDTQFALQCCDESLGKKGYSLKNIAVRYTDLGRYDWDLICWKKKHDHDKLRDGYGLIPDAIMIPYACKDVDTVMRVYPIIDRWLRFQKLEGYYEQILNPFTTDVFTSFCLNGLPIDLVKIKSMQRLFGWAREQLLNDLRLLIAEEVKEELVNRLEESLGDRDMAEGVVLSAAYLCNHAAVNKARSIMLSLVPDYEKSSLDTKLCEPLQAFYTSEDKLHAALLGLMITKKGNFFYSCTDVELIKQAVGDAVGELSKSKPKEALRLILSHTPAKHMANVEAAASMYVGAMGFNPNSGAMITKLLFDIKGYMPVQSTGNKQAGKSPTDWEKVLAMPPEKQREFTPSADKQSLEILAGRYSCHLINRLLEYKSCATLCNGFLKSKDAVISSGKRANAPIEYFVSSQDCVHIMHSAAETGRPTAWSPNTLNWPSWIHVRLGNGVSRVLQKHKEACTLPDDIAHYADMPTKKLPSIRSVVMARKYENDPWCIVEADYQTAEVRGLAYIAGDEQLIKLIEAPDEFFAKVKPESVPEGYDSMFCRIKFPDFVQYPEDKDKYLMTYTKDGKIIAKFTEDDLMRNADGTFVGTKYDMHWGTIEIARRTAREVMNDKSDRGAGKVGNFCIAEGQLVDVLRDESPMRVPIEKVLISDMVWDGDNWVHHDGVLYTGVLPVSEYQGLIATNNHIVWDEKERKIPFEQARMEQVNLRKACGEGLKNLGPRADSARGNCVQDENWVHMRRHNLSALRSTESKRCSEYGEGYDIKVPMPTPVKVQRRQWSSGREGSYARKKVRRNGSKVRERYSCIQRKLQRERNKSIVQTQARVCNLGAEKVAGRNIQRERFRQNRQQRTLREIEPKAGQQISESTEYQVDYREIKYRACSGGHETVPGYNLHGKYGACKTKKRNERRRDTSMACDEPESRWKKETKVKCYDILNAGPKKRFTCSGVLVSNSSAYGAGASNIERKIEQDTGAKPPEGLGDLILEAIAMRQPVATDFLKGQEELPDKQLTYRAASGRLRHLKVLPGEVEGMTKFVRGSSLSALGRECRNFPMQESVAATAARACIGLLNFKRKFNLRGYPMICLYDSVVIHCPDNERMVWSKALTVYMELGNGWEYHGRILRYPIDCEFNEGWSTAPGDERLRKLKDPEYAPTPDSMQAALNELDAFERIYKDYPHLSVKRYY